MPLTDTLFSIFPPPASLAGLSAGVDISSGSVKCLVLSGAGSHTILKSYSEIPLPEGAVIGGDIEDPDKVVDILRTVRLRSGVREAHASLPEKKAYLYQVLIPGKGTNLRAGVEFDFETHVPLPPGEAFFDFEVVRRVEAGTIVSVTAYARRIVSMYQDVFARAGITLTSLEVESQALARAVVGPHDRNGVVMLIDFGRKTTRIAIVEHGVVSFTATVDVGGEALTNAVIKHFNVPDAEAENIKNDKGFLMSKDNKDLVEALMSTVSVVKDEVVRHVSYWNTPPADEFAHKPITKVIVCGGNANLRGFPEYLEGEIGLPVAVADTWINGLNLNRYVPPMHFTESLEYATAIGLALRGQKGNQW